jgi:GNAT superfamily N-acetyltransferase
METITLRPATMQDLPILLEFEQGLISDERPFDTTHKDEEIHYYDLPAMVESPLVELVVAEIDAQIVGCGYARFEKAKPYKKFEQYSYLGFMYVKPEHRGKGINAQVMEYLREWSKKQGLTELRLEVYCDNEKAVRAYEKAGFTRYMYTMRMEA